MEYYDRANILNYYTCVLKNKWIKFILHSVVQNQRLLWNHLPSIDVNAMHVNLFKMHMNTLYQENMLSLKIADVMG